MLAILNTILDTLVRNIDYSIRIIISLAFFVFATWSLSKSIRKKNDKEPIAWGWFIGCCLTMAVSVLYVAI